MGIIYSINNGVVNLWMILLKSKRLLYNGQYLHKINVSVLIMLTLK